MDLDLLESINSIYEDLEKLEELYTKEYISLKCYYETKSNILLKLIGISEVEKESIKTKVELL